MFVKYLAGVEHLAALLKEKIERWHFRQKSSWVLSSINKVQHWFLKHKHLIKTNYKTSLPKDIIMAYNSNVFLVLSLLLTTLLFSAHAADPDITTDFLVSPGVNPNGKFFTFTGLRNILRSRNTPSNMPFKVTKVTNDEFPALNGQSVSYALLQYAPDGLNAPHTHPRSAELLIVIQGCLKVGLVDSTNKLFTQILQTGDIFVFPKGLVHFQINLDSRYPAVALSAFGSANAGTIQLPRALFASGIDNAVLSKSFKVNSDTIQEIVSANEA
ncbi:Germin protein [Dioscorea alata]|uniref:Germin protein n=1 Tax=Dioscorea alata TaxID=55571 RepID=A0ACB7U4G0_DIOAL|nr:Germin protein [Dioscorea alata]